MTPDRTTQAAAQARVSRAARMRPRWGVAVACAVAVAASLIFVAWAKMETVQITYRIDELADQEQELAEQQRRLRSELAELRSPQRLHALAPELGLAAPEPGHVVVVTRDPEGLTAVLEESEESAPAPEEQP